MCNPAGIDVDPNTAVQEASGDNNNQESFNSKNSVITEVNITTSALFICLIFGVFVLVIVLYILTSNIMKHSKKQWETQKYTPLVSSLSSANSATST